MSDKSPWRKELWHRIESIHTAYWLWELAVAAWLAWGSRRLMPHTIGPADYWLPVAVFLGTVAVLTTLTQFVLWLIRKFRFWRHRPSLAIAAHSGQAATVEITHLDHQRSGSRVFVFSTCLMDGRIPILAFVSLICSRMATVRERYNLAKAK